MRSKEEKRAEAKERQKKWESLTLEQQLKAIDERLGKGVGATKQRLKIKMLMEKAKDVSRKKKTSKEKHEDAKERKGVHKVRSGRTN